MVAVAVVCPPVFVALDSFAGADFSAASYLHSAHSFASRSVPRVERFFTDVRPRRNMFEYEISSGIHDLSYEPDSEKTGDGGLR